MAMKPCPFCAEEIQEAAIVCKHCGRDLKGGAQQVQIVEPKKKTGCVAVGCLLLLILFVIGWATTFVSGPSAGSRPAAPPTTLREEPQNNIGIKASCKKAFGIALWEIQLENKGKKVYRDLRYRTIYESESGNRLDTRRGTLQIVLRAGEKRTMANFNDGPMPAQATRCGMVIIAVTEGAR